MLSWPLVNTLSTCRETSASRATKGSLKGCLRSSKMEICVDSVQSAITAEKGGASRLELCSSLVEGGTTPSIGLLRVIKDKVKIPVYVMLRPRGGDFVYSECDFQVMKEDLILLKESGADGIVFDILTPNGDVDVNRSKEIIKMSRPLPITFHRALIWLPKQKVQCRHVCASTGRRRSLRSQ